MGTAEHELWIREAGIAGARLGDPNAGGAVICSVTSFPRIVGSLWRGVGRRRGPRRGSGIGSPPGSRTGARVRKGGSESAQRERAEGDGAGSRVCRAKFAFLSGEACGALPTPDPQEETSHAGRLFRGLSGENPRFRRGVETRG